MFKKIALCLSVVLVLAVHVFAQQSSDPTTLAPTEKALLWKISGKGLTNTSYLFGTIHIIDKAKFELREEVKSSLSASKKVTFEIDMEKMSDFSTLFPLLMKMYMKNDTTLRDLLTKEEYDVVKKHFDKIGLPLAFLERIKPMFLSMMVAEDMQSVQPADDEGEDGIVSYEMELMKLAKEQQIDIDGLETIEYQMSIFDEIPYTAQAKMLLESVQSSGEGIKADDEFDKMMELYINQDIQGMQNIVDGDALGQEFGDIILLNRNQNWIPIMSRMMATEPVFFAVGAGHLGGEKGVIALLRQAGYTVEAVK